MSSYEDMQRVALALGKMDAVANSPAFQAVESWKLFERGLLTDRLVQSMAVPDRMTLGLQAFAEQVRRMDYLGESARAIARANASTLQFDVAAEWKRKFEPTALAVEALAERLLPYEAVREALGRISALGIQPDFGFAARLSLLAEQRLMMPDLQMLRWERSLPFRAELSVETRFTAFTGAYANLYESFEPPGVTAVPPPVVLRPPVELFNGVELLRGLRSGATEDVDDDADVRQASECVALEIGDALSARLAARFPDLFEMLQGAREAFRRRSPDWRRHVLASLRELFTHLIHRLAPDEHVKAIFPNRIFYDDNGRPTRKARLRYIYRWAVTPAYGTFVEKDIEATLGFVGLFQRMHQAELEFTEEEMRLLLVRAEGALRLLIETAADTEDA